jgi:hypothetical protein
MTTVTLDAIITKIVQVVEALTPGTLSSKPFRRAQFEQRSLDSWTPAGGPEETVRLFDLRRASGPERKVGINHRVAQNVIVPLRLRVAYPALPKLYQLSQADQVEGLMQADAVQIGDAVRSVSSRAGIAHLRSDPEIQGLDQTLTQWWFQPIAIDVQFYRAQTP